MSIIRVMEKVLLTYDKRTMTKKLFDKGKHIIEKGYEKVKSWVKSGAIFWLTWLTALTLSGAISSCNSTPKTSEKDSTEQAPEEVHTLHEEANNSWDIKWQAEAVSAQAYKDLKLEEYKPGEHLEYYDVWMQNWELTPSCYKLLPIVVDGKEISLVSYVNRDLFGLQNGNSMTITIKDKTDTIVWTITFWLVQYANWIFLDKLTVAVKVNDVLVTNETAKASGEIKDKSTLDYLVYLNKYAQHLVRAYPIVIKSKVLRDKPRLDSIQQADNRKQHKSDSLKQVQKIKEKAARDLLNKKISEKYSSRKKIK